MGSSLTWHRAVQKGYRGHNPLHDDSHIFNLRINLTHLDDFFPPIICERSRSGNNKYYEEIIWIIPWSSRLLLSKYIAVYHSHKVRVRVKCEKSNFNLWKSCVDENIWMLRLVSSKAKTWGETHSLYGSWKCGTQLQISFPALFSIVLPNSEIRYCLGKSVNFLGCLCNRFLFTSHRVSPSHYNRIVLSIYSLFMKITDIHLWQTYIYLH